MPDPSREGQEASITRERFYVLLLDELLKENGRLMTGEPLYSSLGFGSADAFRKARARSKVPVHVFSIPNRRGTFAMTREVVDWLCDTRFGPSSENETAEDAPYD